MKQPNLLIKVAAVVSSLLLVGGCVSYRAGAFNGLIGASTQPAEPGAPRQASPATTEAAPAMMSSSKSMIFANASAYTSDTPASTGVYTLSLTLTDPPAVQAPATNPKKESPQ